MPGNIKTKITSNITPNKLEKSFLDIAAKQLDARLKANSAKIRKEVKELIKQMILNTPEVEAMRTGGTLAGEFGFEPGEGELFTLDIANIVKTNSRVYFSKVRRIGKTLGGRIRIHAVISDFSDVLSSIFSSYPSEPSGEDVDWLQWLLLEGDKIINLNYGYKLGKSKGSRSGLGVMLKIGKVVKRPYRVSPKFSGGKDDNWLTRAFSDNKEKFIQEVLSILKRYIL